CERLGRRFCGRRAWPRRVTRRHLGNRRLYVHRFGWQRRWRKWRCRLQRRAAADLYSARRKGDIDLLAADTERALRLAVPDHIKRGGVTGRNQDRLARWNFNRRPRHRDIREL